MNNTDPDIKAMQSLILQGFAHITNTLMNHDAKLNELNELKEQVGKLGGQVAKMQNEKIEETSRVNSLAKAQFKGATLGEKVRIVNNLMDEGRKQCDVAKMVGVTPGRISQLKKG